MASPHRYPALHRAAVAAVLANVLIVLTGGVVRVTGSGLGCEEWPRCDADSLVPTGGAEAGWHQYVEFGNRTLTFLLLAIGVWAYMAARREARGRLDLVRLALVQPLGVVGQAVLGGITVLTDLHPLAVASHFLLSMIVLAAAVVLHHRVSETGTQEDPGAGSTSLLSVGLTLIVVAAGVVLVLGTIVTATGPHAGDADVPRLAWMSIRTAAVAHAAVVWFLVGLTIAMLSLGWALDGRPRRWSATSPATRALVLLLGVELSQGALGYSQYALGIPAELVSIHIVGAALVWVAALRARLSIVSTTLPTASESAVELEPVTA